MTNINQELGRFDVPRLPRAKQPYVRGAAFLFGPYFARAIAKKLGWPLAVDSKAIGWRLNTLDTVLTLSAEAAEAGTDDQFLRYAQSIAQHATALATLLYGFEPPQGQRVPGFLPTATTEALYHMGRPPGVSLETVHDETEAAARGVLFLRQSALHAAGQWERLLGASETGGNPGRPHIRSLVWSLAEIYVEAFGKQMPTRPKEDSPFARFCSAVAVAMAHRIQRPERAFARRAWERSVQKALVDGRPKPRWVEPPRPALIKELSDLSPARVAGYVVRDTMRGKEGGANPTPGTRT